MKYRIALLTIALLVGWTAWVWKQPVKLPPPPALHTQVPPALPVIPALPDVEAQAKSLKDSRLLGEGEVAAEAAPLTPPNWRIVGVSNVSGEWVLYLRIDGRPVETLRVGDVLPGGHQIIAIESDRIGVQVGRHARALRIFRE